MGMRLKGNLPLKQWQGNLCNTARLQFISLAFFFFLHLLAILAFFVSFCPEVNTQGEFTSCSPNCDQIFLVVPNEADLISLKWPYSTWESKTRYNNKKKQRWGKVIMTVLGQNSLYHLFRGSVLSSTANTIFNSSWRFNLQSYSDHLQDITIYSWFTGFFPPPSMFCCTYLTENVHIVYRK